MRRLLPAALALTVLLAACGGGGPSDVAADDPRPTIMVTTSILGDVVGDLVQDDATVRVLIGPGVDPHSFSLSASQAQDLREADLVVANGLGLEESLGDALDAAAEDGAAVFEVAPRVDPLPYNGEDDHDDAEDEDASHDDAEGEALDPHVWFSARRMAIAVDLIANEIATVDDLLDDAEWQQRGQALATSFTDLDAEIVDILDVVPADRRVLVTNHDAFEYFADAYDFTILGTVIPGRSTTVDTSAESFGALAELIRDRGVPAIFAEDTSSDRLAQALADEVGRDVQVVVLPSGALGEPGAGADTYAGLMRTVATTIAEVLTAN